MKKIIYLALYLFSSVVFSQTTLSEKVFIEDPDTGALTDSLLVRGADGEIKKSIYQLDDINTSSFKDEATGNPNVLTTTNVYREGRVGLDEPNPEEQLDVIGSVKFEHNYTSGAIVRSQFGGDNLQSEIGIPSGLTEGWVNEFFPVSGGVNNGLRQQVFMGDFSGIGGLDFMSGIGITNLNGSISSRLLSFRSTANTDALTTRMESRSGQDLSRIATYSEGLNNPIGAATFNEEAMNQFVIQNGTITNDTRQSPHGWYLGGIINLSGYDGNTFVENYSHTDDLASTGSAATLIGNLTPLGVDPNGYLGSMPIVTYTFATLPASPSLGDEEIITDANAPTYAGNAAGGGTDVVKVFYNGTNWIYN